MRSAKENKRQVFILILFVLALLLWVTSRRWIPFLLSLSPFIAQNRDLIQTLEAALNILVILTNGFLAVLTWLMIKSPPAAASQPQPLEPCPPAHIIPGRGASIGWVPRGGIDGVNLDANRRLLITGAMKSGKSRAAAELIRRAVMEEKVPIERIYAPLRRFGCADAESVKTAIRQQVDPKGAALLYIEDLPMHFPYHQRDLLAGAFEALQACRCCTIIVDARNDQLDREYREWLRKQGFATVNLRRLNPRQSAELVDAASRAFDLELDQSAKEKLAERSEGNPERLINPLRRLNNQGRRQVSSAEMEAVIEVSLEEEWQANRGEIRRQNPLAGHILDSLALFHEAGTAPITDLICRHALSQGTNTGLIKPLFSRGKALDGALNFLENYDIMERDSRLYYSDLAVETPEPDPVFASQQLGAWGEKQSLHLRRIFRKGLDDEFAGMLFELALSAHLRADLVSAERWYSTSLRFQKTFHALYNRGVIYYLVGSYRSAIQDYSAALRLEPANDRAYNNRGACYAELDSYTEALEDYTHAIELQPAYVLAYHNRADVYIRTSKLAEAEKDIEEADRLDPDNFYTDVRRGQLAYARQQYEAALGHFEQAQSLADDCGEVHLDLALVLLRLGREQEALQLLDERLASSPLMSELNGVLPEYRQLLVEQPDNPSIQAAVQKLTDFRSS